MAVGMTMDELAALLPLEQRIPITDAAKMLGGGATRIKALMDSVMVMKRAASAASPCGRP